jgi:hypothetical protein
MHVQADFVPIGDKMLDVPTNLIAHGTDLSAQSGIIAHTDEHPRVNVKRYTKTFFLRESRQRFSRPQQTILNGAALVEEELVVLAKDQRVVS